MVFTEQQLQVKKLVDVQQDIEIDALNDGVGALSTSMQNGFTEAANNFNDIENSFAAVNTTSNDRYNTLYGAINSLSDAMDNAFLALGNSISNVATNTSDTFNSVNAHIQNESNEIYDFINTANNGIQGQFNQVNSDIANSVTTNLLTANDIYIDTSATPVNSTAALGYDVNGKIIPITTIVNVNVSFPPNADYLYTDGSGTAFAGSFNNFNNNFANIDNQFNNVNTTINSFFFTVSNGFNDISNEFNNYNNQFNDVSNQFNNINSTFLELDNELSGQFNDISNGFNDVYNSFNSVDDTFAGVQNQFNDVNSHLDNIDNTLSSVNWALELNLASLRQPAMIWVNDTYKNNINSIENTETFTGTQAMAGSSFTVWPKEIMSLSQAYVLVNTTAKKAGVREYTSIGVPSIYPPTWMFAGSTSLKTVNHHIMNIGRNAPPIVSAAGVFYNCRALTGTVPILFNAPDGYGYSYLNYAYTFYNTGVSNINLSYGRDYAYTCYNCTNLINVYPSSFTVTNMDNAFAGCTNFVGGSYLNINSVNNIMDINSVSLENSFSNCAKLNPSTGIYIKGAFKGATACFENCKNLNSNISLSDLCSWSYISMFRNCTNLNPTYITLPKNTSITEPGYSRNYSRALNMFRDCTKLNTRINIRYLLDFSNTFAGCTSLNQDIYIYFDLFNNRIGSNRGVTAFNNTFGGCTLLGSKNLHIPSNINIDEIDEWDMNYLTNGYMGVNWSGRILNDIE